MGALSAATCAVYFVPLLLRHAGGIVGLVIAGWNAILFVLWVAVFGVFGDVSSLSLPPSPRQLPCAMPSIRHTSHFHSHSPPSLFFPGERKGGASHGRVCVDSPPPPIHPWSSARHAHPPPCGDEEGEEEEAEEEEESLD